MPRISWTNASTFAALLLLLYPSLALLHRSGASATLHSFSILGVLGLFYGAATKQRDELSAFWQAYGWLCIAMLAPLVVNFISKAYAGAYDGIFSTTVQRAAFTGFALFALSSYSRQSLARFQWGVLLAVPLALFILYQASAGGLIRPEPKPQNLLNYTNFIVLLGLYSLYMLGWRLSRLTVTELVVKVLVFCGALYAVFLSDSRGALLSMGILLAFYFLFRVHWCRLRWRLGLCAAAVLILAILTLQSETMVARIQNSMETMQESVPAMIQGQQPQGGDASSRIRLGLWYASWEMFKQHPWIGDGSQSFAERL